MTSEQRQRAGRGAVVGRLRAATAEAHARLDTALDVVARPWDAAGLRVWLLGTWSLLSPLERVLAERAEQSPAGLGIDLPGRRRADLALGDLVALAAATGVPGPDPAELVEADVPRPRTRAAALGVCYVLDGSTLGGGLIRRQLLAAGLPEQSLTSLTGRPGTGARWRETLRVLETVEEHELPDLLTAAGDTFAAFEARLVRSEAVVGA